MRDTSAGLDDAAFYEREFDHVVRTVRPTVGAAAEDVAQQAFIAALDQWGAVAHLDLPVAWVKTVALGLPGDRRSARSPGPRPNDMAGPRNCPPHAIST